MAHLDDNRWRVMRPQRLRVRRWDDEVVVYDDTSGDTHLLEALPGRILERLLHSSADLGELRALACEPGGESIQEQRRDARVLEAIERLRRKGIVKPLRK